MADIDCQLYHQKYNLSPEEISFIGDTCKGDGLMVEIKPLKRFILKIYISHHPKVPVMRVGLKLVIRNEVTQWIEQTHTAHRYDVLWIMIQLIRRKL